MKRGWLILLACWLAVAAIRAQPQSANDLFQKALSKERAEGQLDDAIQLYQRIVAEVGADRALVARALVQIGRCYERLGRVEAQRAYERVVRDFADQKVSAAEARTRLAALARPAPRGAGKLTVRQVWTGEGVDMEGTVSPDGRYLSFTDWSTGDLAVRDLTTGRNTRLTKKGSWESPEYADFSTISPDGKHVAYAWASADGWYELRVVGTDGSDPRVLIRGAEYTYFMPHAWSFDKKSILTTVYRRDRTRQLAMVAAGDGRLRVVKTLDWRDARNVSLSPDARWIAYDFPPGDGSDDRDIYLLAADGSREVHLIDHPANDFSPVWGPDGRRLVFESDRGSSTGLWSVRIANGQVDGAPEIVKPDMGAVFPLGATVDGALFYGVPGGGNDVFTIEIDAARARTMSAATNAAARFLGFNSTPAFSPDGRSLAFVAVRQPAAPLVPGTRALVIKSLATGEARVLSVAISLGFELSWSPDGRSLLVPGRDVRGQSGVHRVDAATGDSTLLVPGVSTCSVGCSPKGWFPDGRSIYFTRAARVEIGEPVVLRLMRRDLASGDEREILRFDQSTGFRFLTLSPDGRLFAGWLHDPKTRTGVLAVVPAEGGEPRRLTTVTAERLELASIAWSPDSRTLFYVRKGASDKAVDLWSVPIDRGTPQKFGPLAPDVHDLAVHPDGRRIAFSTKSNRPEIWVMENVFPAAAGARAGRR